MIPAQYCLQKAAPAGSTLYYSTLFHPEKEKRQLLALFAFHQELRDTLYECQDPGVARIKLHWWREEVQRLYEGSARHPVTKEFQQLAESQVINASLSQLISTAEHDIVPMEAESLHDIIKRYSSSLTTVWRLTAETSDTPDQAALTRLGALMHTLDIILCANIWLQRGYCPYPLEEMHEQGLDAQSIFEFQHMNKKNLLHQILAKKLEQQFIIAIDDYRQHDSRPTMVVLTAAEIARITCKRLQKQVLNNAPPTFSITPIRKLWIAWRVKKQIN